MPSSVHRKVDHVQWCPQQSQHAGRSLKQTIFLLLRKLASFFFQKVRGNVVSGFCSADRIETNEIVLRSQFCQRLLQTKAVRSWSESQTLSFSNNLWLSSLCLHLNGLHVLSWKSKTTSEDKTFQSTRFCLESGCRSVCFYRKIDGCHQQEASQGATST